MSAACLSFMLLFSVAAHGQTSSLLGKQGWYADPEIHIFAGEYWIYPTTSQPTPGSDGKLALNAQQMALRAKPKLPAGYLRQTSLDAFSSHDLVHWKKHPHVLDIKDVPWAAYAVWAPTAIERDGKYYLFFAANDIQKEEAGPGGISVAVSDKPGGPFRDALGKPLIGSFHNGAQPIDPFIYRDDDEAIYFYFGGQGHCNVARLAPDLKSVIPMADGSLYREITPAHYVEGPFLIKRKGVYYFMWSEGNWTDSSYGVAYATGTSPTGPFTPGGKILQTDPRIANGPGHHSILQMPGTDDWYIAYHRHPLGTTGGNERVLAIDTLRFDSDGKIMPVVMTKDGPAPRPLPTPAHR